MPLTLRVISPQSQLLGAKAVKVFQGSGSIGRTHENAWILPDPERFVSSQHARVAHESGRFYLIDESTNGTSVNGRPLTKGVRVELRSGDNITIGRYEISVTLGQGQGLAQAPTGGSSLSDLFPGAPDRSGAPAAGGFVDFINDGPAPQRPPASIDDHVPAHEQVFTPPPVSRPSVATAGPPRGADVLPKNWWEDEPERRPDPAPPAPAAPKDLPKNWWEDEPAPPAFEPPPAPTPVAAPPPRVEPPPPPPVTPHPAATGTMAMPPVAGASAATRLLEGLGLDPSQVDEAKLVALGQVLRVVVEGTLDVLRARAEVKNQFRVNVTTLKPIDNNPLKFSANADDALFNLFGRRTTGFLTPVEAFREAFDDLKSHQFAMLAGMRSAFDALLKQFDPDSLQEGFDRGLKRAALLDVLNKTKYWELYRELYASFGDDEETFKRLFGDEFARAYDDQLRRLTSARRTR